MCKKSSGVVLGSLSYSKEHIINYYYHFFCFNCFNMLNLCGNVKSFLKILVSPVMLLRSTGHFMFLINDLLLRYVDIFLAQMKKTSIQENNQHLVISLSRWLC